MVPARALHTVQADVFARDEQIQVSSERAHMCTTVGMRILGATSTRATFTTTGTIERRSYKSVDTPARPSRAGARRTVTGVYTRRVQSHVFSWPSTRPTRKQCMTNNKPPPPISYLCS
jgi:hypothetical protein